MTSSGESRPYQGLVAAIGHPGESASDATDDPVAVPIDEPPSLAQIVPSTLQTSLASALDPRLQKLIALRRSGATTGATASTTPGEVAVLARVTDVDAWQALSEVRSGTKVKAPDSDHAFIVTGRVPLSRIEAVRDQSFVLSLKPAQDLKPTLHFSVSETQAGHQFLGSGLRSRGGAGTVIGIIDYGCDFVHQNFRTTTGTRIEAIWHQGGPTSSSSPFGYGAVYEQADINSALKQAAPYSALGYGPARD